MEQAEFIGTGETGSQRKAENVKPCAKSPSPKTTCKAIAAGLFGHSIRYGKVQSFAPMADYIRELEQLPNFTPPSIERFVEQYVRSNIGITRSSS